MNQKPFALEGPVCANTAVRISGIGHALFGFAAMGLALLSLVYGNFGPLMEPLRWPEAWTYALAAIVLAAGAGLFIVRTAAASAIAIGVCAGAWALRDARPILVKPMIVGSWYGSSEAVTMLVGAWTLYAELQRGDRLVPMAGARALRTGRALFGAACVVYGLAHFTYAAYSEAFVPTWLPARMALVYVTGACHAAAGVGLLVGILPRLAATLEAVMITLFGVLVWLPSYFAIPMPKWTGSTHNQWSETLLNFLLAGTAWTIAKSLGSSTQSAANGTRAVAPRSNS